MIDIKDYKCLALDIGGVVCADTWETLFLAKHDGLATKYNLDRAEVLRIGESIWHQYAYSDRDEDEFWQSWEDDLGIHLDGEYIAGLKKKVLWVDDVAAKIVEQCLACGIDVAIVSNSTSFFFPELMKDAGLAKYLPRLKKYLSHEIGYKKTHDKGGLRRLAADTDPSRVLFVEDRDENIKIAKEIGFKTLLYDKETSHSLASALRI